MWDNVPSDMCSQRRFRCRIAVVINKLQRQTTYLKTCAPREDSDAELLYLCYIWAATSENLPSVMCSQRSFRCRIAAFELYMSCNFRKTDLRTCAPREDSDAELLYLYHIWTATSENLPSDMCSQRRFRCSVAVFVLYMYCHIRKLTFRHVFPEKIQMQCCCICIIYVLPHQKTYLQTCVPREDSDAVLLYLYHIWTATSENLPSDMCSQRRFRCSVAVFVLYMCCHVRKLTFGHVFPEKVRMQNCCICIIFELPHQKTYPLTCTPSAELLYLYHIWAVTSENVP